MQLLPYFFFHKGCDCKDTLTAKSNKEKEKERKRKKETTDDRATTERECICECACEREREKGIEEAFNTTEGKTMSESSTTSFHTLQL